MPNVRPRRGEACVVGRERDLLALAAEVLNRAQVQCVERTDDERKGLEGPMRGEWMQFDQPKHPRPHGRPRRGWSQGHAHGGSPTSRSGSGGW